nr:hypothetical protein BgiMline_000141 [Biomphalaria glabrata]
MTSDGQGVFTHRNVIWPPHSGDMFDWWGCSPEGVVLKPRQPAPVPLPRKRLPLRRDQLCWPLCKGATPENTLAATLDPMGDCEVSRNYWPDKKKKEKFPEHQRPPFVPTLAPNQFGLIKYPPPYTYYCRRRDTPLTFVHKI